MSSSASHTYSLTVSIAVNQYELNYLPYVAGLPQAILYCTCLVYVRLTASYMTTLTTYLLFCYLWCVNSPVIRSTAPPYGLIILLPMSAPHFEVSLYQTIYIVRCGTTVYSKEPYSTTSPFVIYFRVAMAILKQRWPVE